MSKKPGNWCSVMKWLRLGQFPNTGFSGLIVSPFSWISFYGHYLGCILLLYFCIIKYCKIYSLEQQAFIISQSPWVGIRISPEVAVRVWTGAAFLPRLKNPFPRWLTSMAVPGGPLHRAVWVSLQHGHWLPPNWVFQVRERARRKQQGLKDPGAKETHCHSHSIPFVRSDSRSAVHMHGEKNDTLHLKGRSIHSRILFNHQTPLKHA